MYNITKNQLQHAGLRITKHNIQGLAWALGCYIYQRQVYQQCRNLINRNRNNKQMHNYNKGATHKLITDNLQHSELPSTTHVN